MRVDHVGPARRDRLQTAVNGGFEFRYGPDRPFRFDALGAGDRSKIGRRIVDPLPDPTIFDRPIARLGHHFLVDLVVEIRAVVGHDEQRGQTMARGGPQRGDSLQEVAVAQDGHDQPPAVEQRERCADRQAGPCGKTGAAIVAEKIERLAEMISAARPTDRDVGEADISRAAQLLQRDFDVARCDLAVEAASQAALQSLFRRLSRAGATC